MKPSKPSATRTAFAAALIVAIWAAFLVGPIAFFVWAIPTLYVSIPLSLVWAIFCTIFAIVGLMKSV